MVGFKSCISVTDVRVRVTFENKLADMSLIFWSFRVGNSILYKSDLTCISSLSGVNSALGAEAERWC